MYFTFLNLPSVAKAQDFQGLPCGTAEAVPFQNMKLMILTFMRLPWQCAGRQIMNPIRGTL